MSDLTAPRREVLAALGRRLEDEEPAVLATVVAVDGSAYRRGGAKAVVDPDRDEPVGAITASCLIDEVRGLATDVLADGHPRVERFDLTGDGDEWGFGLGCNGVVDVLLEPVDDSLAPAVESFRAGRDAALATVVGSDDDRLAVGDRAYLAGPDERAQFADRGTLPGDVLEALLAAVGHGAESGSATSDPDASAERPGSDDRASGTVDVGSGVVDVETDRGPTEIFVDRIAALPDLVVVGTGQDVRPVVDLARTVDFRVTVAGFRGGAATEARFPAADRVVATSPARITRDVTVDDRTYVVLLTHNFVDDRIALEELVQTAVPYVGILGQQIVTASCGERVSERV
jgi:xanthine dehydrogenase accessory factor